MSGAVVRVARVVPHTTAEGPGTRWALWVQGCTIGCIGCCNPHTWDTGGAAISIDELITNMLAAPVEGITLLGGEPFEQGPAMAELAEAAQANGRGVMTFTGYRYEVLRRSGNAGWHALLSATDVLVDGPFLNDRIDTTRPWVGSTNQRFIHLTDRYRDYAFDAPDRLEIRVRRDGAIAINGWPEPVLVEGLEDLLDGV